MVNIWFTVIWQGWCILSLVSFDASLEILTKGYYLSEMLSLLSTMRYYLFLEFALDFITISYKLSGYPFQFFDLKPNNP